MSPAARLHRLLAMAIPYAPDYLLSHRPHSRPPRAVPDLVRLGLVAALVGVLVAAGAGTHLLNTRSAARLDAAMVAAAQSLLPGGRVGNVEVGDGPALLAERRTRVQQTTVAGRTRDGHAAHLVVRGYDRAAGVAQSVSWQIAGLPLPAGWHPVSSPTAYLSQIEREIDGRQVRMTATASLQGDRVLVGPGRLTVDGTPTTLDGAPPAVRAAVEPMLAPRVVDVPVPGAAASVRSVWFDDGGMGVELQATEVSVGTAGGR